MIFSIASAALLLMVPTPALQAAFHHHPLPAAAASFSAEALPLPAAAASSESQPFQKIPVRWKWISDEEVAFTYDGTYTDSCAFSVLARSKSVRRGIKAPEKFQDFPLKPDGAVNLTFSPDSTKLAYTREGDLWVVDIASGKETRLTSDGSDLILNGYASWVYYEEILGRPSQYRAFWWSPDSQKLGFYRFDNSKVPVFPIYHAVSADGNQGGSLSLTRYPKAGQPNPSVRIGMTDLEGNTVWADFDEDEDQYFGIPFWSADSRHFYISREPRIQNTLDLYAVNAADGSKRAVYHEKVDTWLEWIEGMVFTEKGLYMSRDFQSGYEQIYFLSYDGTEFRQLTTGSNWRVNILRVDEKSGEVFYTANRDATTKAALYKLDKKGEIKALTDTSYAVSGVSFSPDGKYFVASVSNYTTPHQVWLYETASAELAWKARAVEAAVKGISENTLSNAGRNTGTEVSAAAGRNAGMNASVNSGKKSGRNTGKRVYQRYASSCLKVADMAAAGFNPSEYALFQTVTMTTADGFVLPASIVYPLDFDPSKKYPVHMEIYGGPNTAYVRDRWIQPGPVNQWWSENGIIHIICDARCSGHNGRTGLDQVYRNLTEKPVQDFVAWARWLKSKPYVMSDKIGVEGFSFGGTMTTLLLCEHSDDFHYGIAGGGVYDWMLYDTHYTERFMETPQSNPEGYAASRVLNHVSSYPVRYDSDTSVMLKLTHGTGDDNVHFQNTLQLIDAFHKDGKIFEFMIYPDGLHGYRGYQGRHSTAADHAFWLRYLLGK